MKKITLMIMFLFSFSVFAADLSITAQGSMGALIW